MEFPKVLYVTQAGDKGDEYWSPWTEPSASEADGDKVAIYELREVKALRLTTELV